MVSVPTKISIRTKLIKVVGRLLPFYRKYQSEKGKAEDLRIVAGIEGREHVIFTSYEEAASASGEGYQHQLLAEVVVKKTELVAEKALTKGLLSLNELNVLTALILLKKKQINALDIGGAAGDTFFRIEPYVRELNLDLSWTILETEAMRSSAVKSKIRSIKYVSHEDLEKECEYDIALMSGVIQCVSDPIEYLELVNKLNIPFVFFGRNSFLESKKNDLDRVIVIQESWLSSNGPGALPEGYINQKVSYPITQILLSEFLSALSKNYECILDVADNTGRYLVKGYSICGGSFLFKRKGT